MYEIKQEKCKECNNISLKVVVPYENYIQRLARKIKLLKRKTRWGTRQNQMSGSVFDLNLGETKGTGFRKLIK